MYSAPWFLPGVLVAGAVIIWALRWLGSLPPRDVRDDAADRAQHPAGRALPAAEPAIRTTWPGGRVPGAERDGEPLSDEEWEDLNGCLWASNTHIPEPRYGGDRG